MINRMLKPRVRGSGRFWSQGQFDLLGAGDGVRSIMKRRASSRAGTVRSGLIHGPWATAWGGMGTCQLVRLTAQPIHSQMASSHWLANRKRAWMGRRGAAGGRQIRLTVRPPQEEEDRFLALARDARLAAGADGDRWEAGRPFPGSPALDASRTPFKRRAVTRKLGYRIRRHCRHGCQLPARQGRLQGRRYTGLN